MAAAAKVRRIANCILTDFVKCRPATGKLNYTLVDKKVVEKIKDRKLV